MPLLRRLPAFGSQPRAPRFRSALVRAGLLRASLLLTVLVAGARAVALLVAALLIDRPNSLAPRVLIDVLGIIDVLTLATLVVAVMTWLLWVAWTSRLEENAAALGAGDGSIGPRGAILWWLVPGANLLVPFGQLLGLDRRLSNAERPAHDLLIATWWIAFLAVGTVLLATTAAIGLGDTSAHQQSPATLLQAALASFAWLVVALIAVRVVREVQRDEDRRGVTVREGWRPGAPSWAVAPQPNYPAMPPQRRAIGWKPLSGIGPVIAVVAIAGGIWVAAMVFDEGPGTGGLVTTARPTTAAAPTPRRTPAPTTKPAPGTAGPVGTPLVEPPLPTPSVDPVAAGNKLLLAHATAGDGECAALEAAERPGGAVAAISCRPANGAVASLRYSLYESPDAAVAAYQLELDRSTIASNSGACFDGLPGETSFSTNQSTRGRVVCWMDDAGGQATPTFVWYDRTLAIVGEATGTGSDLNLLSSWWVDESGPA